MKKSFPLTIVFFGSSKYSVIAAGIIQKKLGLALVVTNPDRPTGRKRQLTSNPVKQFAQKNKLALLTTDKLDRKALETISKASPDFLIVADYGKILPKALLDLPKYAALNIHHSLLPKYRGPSPAPAVILAGDKITGVTIISMTEKIDTGDILAQEEYTLAPDETTDSLLVKLNMLGGQLVIDVIENYSRGKVKTIKQDELQATYTHRFTKEDGRIDPDNPPDPQTFNRMVRAYHPWPGVWTQLKTHNSKLITIKFLPGNLIQPEGKRPLTFSEFMNGYPAVYEQIKHVFSSKVPS